MTTGRSACCKTVGAAGGCADKAGSWLSALCGAGAGAFLNRDSGRSPLSRKELLPVIAGMSKARCS